MAKIVLGYDDRLETAVVTGPAVSTLPASNLTTADMTQRWQTSIGTNSATLLADLGAVYTIGASVLDSLNITSAGTVRFRASATSSTVTTAVAWDSGSFSPDPTFRYAAAFALPAVSVRYLRADVADTNLTFLAASRWWAFRTLQPGVNYAYGAQRLLRDPSARSQLESGGVFVNKRPVARGLQVPLPAFSIAEHDASLEPMQRLSGMQRDILVCLDPASANVGRDTVVGLLDEVITIQRNYFNRYGVSRLTVYERI